MSTPNPYESPESQRVAASPTRNWTDYSPVFNGAMWTGLKVQAVLAVLTALMLDSGQIHREFWVAMLCQWSTVFMILVRRPMAPTKLDLAVVRYGIIPLLLIVAIVGPHFLRFLGIPSG